MLLVLGLLFLGGAALAVLQAVAQPRAARQASLRRVKSYALYREQRSAKPEEERVSLVQAVVPALSRVALRFTPRVQRDELQGRLLAAGLAARLTVQQFLA